MNPQAVLEPDVMGETFDLPQGWEMRPLMHALRAVDMRHRGETIQPDQDYRLLTVKLYAKGVTLRSQVKGSQIGVAKLYRTQPGDFVMSKIDARNGAWGFIPEDLIGGMVSNDFPLLQLRPEHADPDFLTFLLSRPSARAPLVEQAIGSTGRRRVQVDDFLLMEFPFPPLTEQQAIAAALRAARAARDAAANVLEQTRELKRSLLRHLFTYGPVAVQDAAKVELKETDYGSININWDMEALSSVAAVTSGITLGKKYTSADNLVEVPYLRVANVQDGYINTREIKKTYIKKSDVEKYRLRFGDVLMTEGGDDDKLGRGFLWNDEIKNCSYQNHVFVIRTNQNEIDNEYFAFQIQSAYAKLYFRTVAHRTTNLASINSTKLKAYPVIKPPASVQVKIKEKMWGIEKKIISAKVELQARHDFLVSMVRDLLTGRIRVPSSAKSPQGATP